MSKKDEDKLFNWWADVADKFKMPTSSADLNPFEQAFVNASTAIDHFLSSAASLQISGQLLDNIDVLLLHKHDEWKFYTQEKFFKDNNTFFTPPQEHEFVVTPQPADEYFPGADISMVEFVSQFEPVSPHYSAGYINRGGRVATAKYIKHPEEKRPTIVAIHGMANENFAANSFILQFPEMYKQGSNILYFTLPFHGSRKLPESLMSGEAFLTLNVTTINEHMAYAIHDLRAFLNFLEDEDDSTQIGIVSYSLGGYLAALATEVDTRFDFAVILVPIASPLDAVLSWDSMNNALVRTMKAKGIDANDVRHAMAVHSPLSHKTHLDQDRIFLMGSESDKITVSQHTRLLWEHWGKPEIHWDKGNHIIQLNRQGVVDAIGDFLRKKVLKQKQ